MMEESLGILRGLASSPPDSEGVVSLREDPVAMRCLAEHPSLFAPKTDSPSFADKLRQALQPAGPKGQ